LVGWLLAGLSGIVNATIAFDVVVHNTLWIVGHFHHMAMLNIGLLIFGAVYALLPELSGKALYSESMARVHVWTTFLAGMTFFGIWLVQGLEGAPRRWSVLPTEYDTLTRWSLPFVFLLAAVQLLFFWNVIQTLRGKGGLVTLDDRGLPLPSQRRDRPAPVSEAILVLAALGLAAVFAIAGYLVGRETADSGGATVTVTEGGTTTGEATPTGDAAAGAEVFAAEGCGSCHTFTPAGATGTVGVNLDQTQLTAEQITTTVSAGRGAMPAFGERLSPEQIADVTAYIAGDS
jgi:mono/diheme cytochrome c family protein